MFYEGRVTTVWNIDKDEIASLWQGAEKYFKHVKNQKGEPQRVAFYMGVIYQFEHNGKKYGFADDASNCEGIVELAILDMDENVQIESLTIDWVKGRTKAKAILDCCDNPYSRTPTGITIVDNEVISQPKTYFTCGCCGSGFKSTYKEQAIYDQDAGYGICDSCNSNWR